MSNLEKLKINEILKTVFEFDSAKKAKSFLKKNAVESYDCYFKIVKKNGFEIFYSSNCKKGYEFQIGLMYKGVFKTLAF